MVALEPVHAELGRQADQRREILHVQVQEGHLHRDGAAGPILHRVGIAHGQELVQVLQLLFEAGAHHDPLLGLGRCAVPGDLDVRGDRDDLGRPVHRAPPREGPVGGEVELDAQRRAQVHQVIELRVEQRFAHGGGDDLPEAPPVALRDDGPDQVEGHPPVLSAAFAFLPERRVLLAHQAGEVAVVRVGVEGDAPWRRPGLDPRAGGQSDHAPIEPLDLLDMLLDVRDIPRWTAYVAPRTDPGGVRGVLDHPGHSPGQGSGIPVSEDQPVDPVLDQLSHAACIRGDHRHAGLLRLVDHERRVLHPDRGDYDGVHAVKHLRNDVLVAILGEPLHPGSGAPGKAGRPGLQRVGVLSTRPAPDAQPRVPWHLAERIEELVDPLCGDVRPDITEGEGLSRRAPPATQALEVEAVVQVDQLALRDAEAITISRKEVASRCDEQVHELDYVADMLHPARHPVPPVGHIHLPLLLGSAEVPGIATLGAATVLLPLAGGPEVRGVRRVHLHELAARAHEPVVVERVDDGDGPGRSLHDQGRGEVVQVPDMDNLRPHLLQAARELPVHPGVPVAVPAARHVDQVERYPGIVGIVLLDKRIVGLERVLEAGKDMDLVAIRQALTQGLGVDLGPRVVPHGVAMNDLQDPHDAPP